MNYQIECIMCGDKTRNLILTKSGRKSPLCGGDDTCYENFKNKARREVEDRISGDYYEPDAIKFPYRTTSARVYTKELRRLEIQFKKDALEAAGLTGHSRADKAFELAREYGHSEGEYEVLNHLIEFAEIVK